MRPNEAKWGQIQGHSRATVGKQCRYWTRTRTTVTHQGPHHSPYPLPRVHHHHAPRWSTTSWPGTPLASAARTGSPGFFRIQSRSHNTELSKTDTFLIVKNRPVKNELFWHFAYLILITFYKSAVFALFAEKHHFWHFSWHLWFTTVFSRFSPFLRSQVFPRDLRKMTKFNNILRKTLKLALFPKMSPTNLTSRNVHFFVNISWKSVISWKSL